MLLMAVWTVNDGNAHGHEPYECYCRADDDAAGAENIGIELFSVRATANHEQKTYDDEQSRCAHENEVFPYKRKFHGFIFL